MSRPTKQGPRYDGADVEAATTIMKRARENATRRPEDNRAVIEHALAIVNILSRYVAPAPAVTKKSGRVKKHGAASSNGADA